MTCQEWLYINMMVIVSIRFISNRIISLLIWTADIYCRNVARDLVLETLKIAMKHNHHYAFF